MDSSRLTQPSSLSSSHQLNCSPFHNGCHAAWENLPEELVARVLALLPFSSMYRARMVCRKWRSVVWSPLFFSFCRPQPSRLPWLLEFQQHMYNQVWAYDLAGNQWFHVSFSFLPENATVVATAGGLICLGSATREGYTLFLCNPMTRVWKRLPQIPVEPGLVIMNVDSTTNCYKIVALVLRGQRETRSVRPTGSVFVYDSHVHEWKETLGMPQELHTKYLHDATLCHGIMYCLIQEEGVGWQVIKAYDLDQGAWSPIFMQGPSNAVQPRPWLRQRINRHLLHRQLNRQRVVLRFNLGAAHAAQVQAPNFDQILNQASTTIQDSYILERQGQLMMVTSCEETVLLNEFDVSTRRWKRANFSKGEVVCAGHFSSMSFHKPEGGSSMYVTHSGDNKCFTAASRSWYGLPSSPISRNKTHGGQISVKGLWFEPRIDAVI